MSAWPGKYVIGLTGNIATGKSVIRKMLEHLGAFGIDADGISHQAMAKGGPAYADVVKMFGEFVLADDGQIDRATLGQLVFSNPKALAKLETIIHPAVRQAMQILVTRAKQPVIVIEAIKLLEGELAAMCDAIWVVNVPPEVQVARLVEKRKMAPDAARLRIASQNPQADKLKKANVIIQNGRSYEDSWSQVQVAWEKALGQSATAKEDSAPIKPVTPPQAGAPVIRVRRGKPTDAAAIASFITEVSNRTRQLSRADVMEAFGQKAFVLAQVNEGLGALAGWQVENLVTRVDDFYFSNGVHPNTVVKPMLESIELASRDLQSEASFLFVAPALQQGAAQAFTAAGYEAIEPAKLGINAWREAVRESQPEGTIVLFKKLREDRVLRPV